MLVKDERGMEFYFLKKYGVLFRVVISMIIVSSCTTIPKYHLLNFRDNKVKQEGNFVHVFHKDEKVPSIAKFLRDTIITLSGAPFGNRLDLIENKLTKFGQSNDIDLIHITKFEVPNYQDRFYKIDIDIFDFKITKEYLLDKYGMESGIFFYQEYYTEDIPELSFIKRDCQKSVTIIQDSLNNRYGKLGANMKFLLPINENFGHYKFYAKSQQTRYSINVKKGEVYFINCLYYNDYKCQVVFELMELDEGWDYWRKIKMNGKTYF